MVGYGLVDIFVTYFTGSLAIAGVFISSVFAFTLLVLTRDFRMSIALTLPVFGFFVLAGWLGTVLNSEWIINLILMVLGLFYGRAVLKMISWGDTMPVCLGCGRNYKTYYGDTRKTVNSCSHCISLFSDKAADKIIDDFFK